VLDPRGLAELCGIHDPGKPARRRRGSVSERALLSR